jgi:hypothetical protein
MRFAEIDIGQRRCQEKLPVIDRTKHPPDRLLVGKIKIAAVKSDNPMVLRKSTYEDLAQPAA